MDELNTLIESILSDEQSMQKLQEMASSLGLTGAVDTSGSPASGGTEFAGLMNLLSGHSSRETEELPFDPTALMGLVNALRDSSQNDPNTDFLRALKPLLKRERQGRVEEAIRMMRLFALWPVIRQSGVLGHLLG